jgi:hypothetical protein
MKYATRCRLANWITYAYFSALVIVGCVYWGFLCGVVIIVAYVWGRTGIAKIRAGEEGTR